MATDSPTLKKCSSSVVTHWFSMRMPMPMLRIVVEGLHPDPGPVTAIIDVDAGGSEASEERKRELVDGARRRT